MHRGGYIAGSNVDLSDDVHPNFAKLGDRVRIRAGTILFGSMREILEIGDDTYINAKCVLQGGSAKLLIGKRVSFGVGVVIHTDSGPNTSPLIQKDFPLTGAPVTIEDDVWIGTYAVILPGVTIGRGSIVGAHSLVKQDVPPRTKVGGVPARVLGKIED